MTPDHTIRQLLQSQLWAAKRNGLIQSDYKANPAILASMALDCMDGNTELAIRTLCTAVLYLQQIEKEEKLPVVASPPLAANDDHENAEGDDR